MISTIEDDKCTGCKLCGDICPTKAISFLNHSDGCWYPKIDNNKCIKCNLCEKKCPAINAVISNNNDNPDVLAVWTKNDNVRYESTSGGVYFEIAKKFLDEGGYISGCVFFDNYKGAKHIVSNDQDDIYRIMGSKYFQSDTAGIYNSIKELLKEGNKILFCGTPCQVAALNSYLKDKYSDLLYTLDFICKGINSPKAYRAYISEIESNYKAPIHKVRQKSKKTGWQSLATNIQFADGREYHKDRYTDWWIQGYTCGNLFMRLNCAKCLYKEMPRQADLSFGDFWEIEGCSDEDMQKGISVVFVNNDKGKQLINSASDCLHIEKRQLTEVLKGNPYLFGQASQNGDRSRFFELLEKEKFSTAVKKTYTETAIAKLKRYTKLFLKRVFKRKKW